MKNCVPKNHGKGWLIMRDTVSSYPMPFCESLGCLPWEDREY